MPVAKSGVVYVKGSRTEQDKSDPPFISEGVRQEIEIMGWAVDPATGKRLTKADLPK